MQKTFSVDPDVMSGLQKDFWSKYQDKNVTTDQFSAFLKLSKKQRDRLLNKENPFSNIVSVDEPLLPEPSWRVVKHKPSGYFYFDKLNVEKDVVVVGIMEYLNFGYREKECPEVINKLMSSPLLLADLNFSHYIFKNSEKYPITRRWSEKYETIWSLGTLYKKGLVPNERMIAGSYFREGYWMPHSRYVT